MKNVKIYSKRAYTVSSFLVYREALQPAETFCLFALPKHVRPTAYIME